MHTTLERSDRKCTYNRSRRALITAPYAEHSPKVPEMTCVNPAQCRVMKITQLGGRTADSLPRCLSDPHRLFYRPVSRSKHRLLGAYFHPVLTQTCLPNHCLRIDVIILGVSSSASLILVPPSCHCPSASQKARFHGRGLMSGMHSSGELQAEGVVCQLAFTPLLLWSYHNQLFERLLPSE